MHWQYRTIYRGQNSILNNLYNTIGPKAHDYISFYGLRAYGKLSEDGPVATSQVTIQSFMDQICALLPFLWSQQHIGCLLYMYLNFKHSGGEYDKREC